MIKTINRTITLFTAGLLSVAFVAATTSSYASAVWMPPALQSGPAPTNITVNTGDNVGYLSANLAQTTSITIEPGSIVEIYSCYSSYTLTADILFNSGPNGQAPGSLVFSDFCEPPFGLGAVSNESLNAQPLHAYVIAGDVSLQADASISSFYTSNSSIKLTGTVARNGNNLKMTAHAGAKIMGNGYGADLHVARFGLIAPGNSPGVYNSGDLALDGGSGYQFELGGGTPGTEYDQINVNGSVTLDNPTLLVEQWNGFQPTNNQQFTIINNDGVDPVIGTFEEAPENTHFSGTYNGVPVLYSLSYVGGDGNDVVLTYVGLSDATEGPTANEEATPGVPNTGASLTLANPLVIIVTGLLAVVALVVAHKVFSRR